MRLKDHLYFIGLLLCLFFGYVIGHVALVGTYRWLTATPATGAITPHLNDPAPSD